MAKPGRRGVSAESNHSYLSFSAADWWYHSHAHADFQLMKQVAQDRQVLIVNSLGMRSPKLKDAGSMSRVARKLRSIRQRLKEPEANIAVLSPVFLPVYGPGKLAEANAWLVALQVRGALRRLGMVRPHCVVANPTALAVQERVPCADLSFYRVDAFSATEDVDQALISVLEDEGFRRSDRTMYSSSVLLEREQHRHRGKGVAFEHGVNLDAFDPAVERFEPEDLRPIGHPRVMLVGTLEHDDRRRQLATIASALPQFQFVAIGGHVADDPRLRLSNLHLLGTKDHTEIPSYLFHADIALLLVAQTAWGAAASPIKLKEYLAVGLPIVASPFGGVEAYVDVLRVGRTDEEVIEALLQTAADLGPGDVAQRRLKVAGESWASKAAEFRAMVGDPPGM